MNKTNNTNSIEVVRELIDDVIKVSNQALLKKGFYKVSFDEDSFILINLKEDTWSDEVDKYITDNYKQYHSCRSFKRIDYILDYKEKDTEITDT